MKSRLQSRTGNRRKSSRRLRKQQHLLDVTVRSRKAAQRRNRFLTRAFFSLVIFGGLVAGVWWSGREMLNRFLWENPDYALRDVRTYSDGKLSRAEILDAGGIREGVNIFSVKLSDARSRLQQLPQVEYVEMTRTLPDTITVKITERRPAAWVVRGAGENPASSQNAFLVDEKGILFQPASKSREVLVLPVIHGADVDQLRAGEAISSPELVAALNLLRLAVKEPRFIIRGIDVSHKYCLVATDRQQAQVTFGLERLDFQLERLSKLLNYVDDSRQEIRTVNLMVERNVPALLAPLAQPEEEVAPEQPAKQAAPARPAPPAPAARTTPASRPAAPARPRATPVRRAAPAPAAAPDLPVRRALPVTR